jgi:mannose-6-phosphate isomerase-like protein (cupin superfamily)
VAGTYPDLGSDVNSEPISRNGYEADSSAGTSSRATETMAGSVHVFELDDMKFSATAALFEGLPRAGIGISVFVVRTPPGGAVELHTHPYSETFLLLEGRGRWTAAENVVELVPNQMLVVPAEEPHGFRNTGDEPLLLVSVHESGTLDQTFLGRDPA